MASFAAGNWKIQFPVSETKGKVCSPKVSIFWRSLALQAEKPQHRFFRRRRIRLNNLLFVADKTNKRNSGGAKRHAASEIPCPVTLDSILRYGTPRTLINISGKRGCGLAPGIAHGFAVRRVGCKEFILFWYSAECKLGERSARR